MSGSLDDKQLIERAIAGDDGVYQMLVERYENLVWDLLNRTIVNDADQEELAQDVFVRAFFSLQRFRFDSKFSAWFYTITDRAALSFLRKAKPETVEFESQHEKSGFSEESEQPVMEQQLLKAIDELSVDDWTVITQYHLHNCTIEEISTVVEKPEGRVKNQLFRVRKKSKSHLTEDM
jgi:RNA polymerase sigma-70 factor (ECF subfamily)